MSAKRDDIKLTWDDSNYSWNGSLIIKWKKSEKLDTNWDTQEKISSTNWDKISGINDVSWKKREKPIIK